MKSLLEPKVVQLSLETGILGVSVVVAQDMILKRFGVKNHNLADAPEATAQMIRFIFKWHLPCDQVINGFITKHGEEMAEKLRDRVADGFARSK